jgi:hypothetical protein
MTMHRLALLLLLFALALACAERDGPTAPAEAAGPDPLAGAEKAEGQIDEAFLRSVVEALSDDALEGRGPGSDGDEAARAYIAHVLEEHGIEPGAGEGWEQPIDLVGLTSHMPPTWGFVRNGETVSFHWWDEYIAATGVQEESVTVDEAEVVFVGYGIEAPEEDWDDFKGADVSGKILLFLNNDPDWDPELFSGERRL